MKEMKRVLALLLCFVMLVGILPAGVLSVRAEEVEQTAEKPVVVIAGSDFQEKTCHSNTEVTGILTRIKKDYGTADGFLFGGDYCANTTEDKDHTKNGIKALMDAVQKTYSNLNESNSVLIQGNHDSNHAAVSDIAVSGNNDKYAANGAYGVYVINEDDYQWNKDATADEVKATADKLAAYLQEKIEEKYTKPIFVVSHLPLHYTFRTPARGDGRYAKYIFDVLNDAGEQGLNIIFLFGHNHSEGYDTYLGGGAIFLKEDDRIWIANPSSYEAAPVEYELNFTYMNCGYVGYSGDTADDTLTMSVFEITGNEVTIKRYSADGVHALKTAGMDDRDSCAYGGMNYYVYQPKPNTQTYDSPQTITLKQFIPDVTVEDKTTNITVTAPGITGVTVSQNTSPVYDSTVYSAYASYDIELDGYTQGHTATVTVLAPDGFDESKPAVVLYDGAVIATDTDITDGITFTTDHFSLYDFAQYDDDAVVTVTGNLVGSKTVSQNAATAPLQSGYYLIVPMQDNNTTADPLTGENLNNGLALDLNAGLTVKDNSVWYYDGTHIRYQSADGNYLRLGTQERADLTANANETGVVNNVIANNNGTFSPAIANQQSYLNRVAGGDGDRAGQYNQNNDGSKWYFYEIITTTADPVTLQVAPKTVSLMPGTTKDLAYAVLVDGKETSDYTITWTSSNSAVATVDENGKVTGVADGDVTITATLTNANGQDVYGTVAVEIPVNVATRTIQSITIDSKEGSVPYDAGTYARTGSTLTITYTDESTETIPVTVSMLSGTYNLKKNGTYTGLTVTYAGKTVPGYTLNVVANDFPSYPEGGSVKVNKTGVGQDFQNTGVARIELSTSGLPSQKGVDLVVMLDTSSSMKHGMGDTTNDPAYEESRLYALHQALRALIETLQTKDANGEYLDIDIAIADFNTFTPISDDDYFDTIGNRGKGDENLYTIFTGDGDKVPEAGDFVAIESIKIEDLVDRVQAKSGTNYDYAFETIYDLAAAKQAANEEDRDLYVIFMTDGAPYQFNYYTGNTGAGAGHDDTWDHWLTGGMTPADWAIYMGEHKYFYNEYGLHWMAEAIKGDPEGMYTVIRPDVTNPIDVTNDGTPDEYMTKVPGLGATMYAIALSIFNDGVVSMDTTKTVIENIASRDANNKPLYVETNQVDVLVDTFASIGNDVRYAAQNAYFLDQMGDDFNLQMNPTIPTNNKKDYPDGYDTNISTDITVKEYLVYTKAQVNTTVNGHTVTADDVGKTYGDGTVLETVWFDANGNAYSDQIYTTGDDGKKTYTNILNDGVICAKNFFYNTTPATETITLANGKEYNLPSETFYWNIGLINEKQYTLSYAVYLTGSMEGTRPEGSYDTNEYATLYYTNWLGNDVSQSVPTPTLPWGSANVSYVFYLVNEDGKPLNAKGEVVENVGLAHTVTIPVLREIYLNSGYTVSSNIVAGDVLAEGYTLYDPDATYTIKINSGTGGGSWTIAGATESTYVTGYAGAQDYSNEISVNEDSYDYTHTTVYFAVVWTIGTVPDTVVIDYGLPVDIDVLSNDMFGGLGTLVGIGMADGMPTTHTTELNTNKFGTSVGGTYGAAVIDSTTGKVRYTPANMQMNGYEKFAYAVNYTGTTNPGYYYGTVTVIPATTIYYEDSFLTLESYTWEEGWKKITNSDDSLWTKVGKTVAGATQAEDRPGKYSLTDANNIYGYDDVNLNMSTFSLGSAMKAAVDYDNKAEASFEFYGTGFDIISMTNNETGSIYVTVYDYLGNRVGTKKMVDTYYGYKQELGDADGDGTIEEGEVVWVVDPDSEDSIYQVPVIKVEGLTYGKYKAVIEVVWEPIYDNVEESTGYDFYLDAIRIYDPANDGAADGSDDTTIEDAYIADGEGWPSYIELRNKLIEAETLGNSETSTEITGLVFIDGDASVDDAQIRDYVSYGPNNEVYLAPGQRVAFIVSAPANIANVHIGLKSADGKAASYTIVNIAKETKTVNGKEVTAGTYYNARTYTVSTTTDMYYDLTPWVNGDIIVISNYTTDTKTDGTLSITNIKSTYTSDPAGGAVTVSDDLKDDLNNDLMTASLNEETYIYMTPAAATLTLRTLNSMSTEETVPEEPAPFKPESMTVSLSQDTVKAGHTVIVTVRTSADVDSLTVNGETVTQNIYSRWSGTKTWILTVRPEEAGQFDISVVANNAGGEHSEPVTTTVTVEEKSGSIWGNLLSWIFG